MIERSMLQNLAIMFIILPSVLIAFWWFLRMVNWSTGVDLKAVMEKIYSDPLASAIYRGAVIITVAQLVISAFFRIV